MDSDLGALVGAESLSEWVVPMHVRVQGHCGVMWSK